MKILLSLFVVLISIAWAPIHDVPMAVFHITKTDKQVNLNVHLDLEDYCQSLGVSPSAVKQKNLQDYLNKNTRFQFNDRVATVSITEVKIIRDHIKAKGNLGILGNKIETIKIENSCLNNIPNHSNVIQVDLNNTSKDYRMHKKRTVITLAY